MEMGIDQLNLHSVQLGYLKILQMGNADPNNTKAGKQIRGSVNPSQLGGRHSNPIVTTPMIALDFSGTTTQSASHNVALISGHQSICQAQYVLATRQSSIQREMLTPKLKPAGEHTKQTSPKSFEHQYLRTSTPTLIQRSTSWYQIPYEKPAAGYANATKTQHLNLTKRRRIAPTTGSSNQQLVTQSQRIPHNKSLAAGTSRNTQNAAFRLIKTTSLYLYDWFFKPSAGRSFTHRSLRGVQRGQICLRGSPAVLAVSCVAYSRSLKMQAEDGIRCRCKEESESDVEQLIQMLD
ncbi:peroxisome biogenesis protein 1 [Dorcoceras hygrometricum]|uniref:Peroxisome biogenesis protein 1 n=1 Tax=Dorcoceras hygrometricum TaxID=472368 RepID=A0A2Z7CHQ8_9LAMI|nr:peroxisome biogenesis protein 1 [Dorcoceras hygrometricum]